jgi:hypothetical protein
MLDILYQEMVKFMLKPQYQLNVNILQDKKICNIDPIILEDEYGIEKISILINKGMIVHNKIIIYH